MAHSFLLLAPYQLGIASGQGILNVKHMPIITNEGHPYSRHQAMQFTAPLTAPCDVSLTLLCCKLARAGREVSVELRRVLIHS